METKALTQRQQDAIRAKARKQFIKYLDRAIEACYLAEMDNNGAVLSMPIKELYAELTREPNGQ